MSILLEDLIVAVEGYRLTNYFDVASFAIYAYDYMLTFEDERSIMWPKRWSLMKVLFFIVRYLPLVDLTITFVEEFRTDLSPEVCSFAVKSAASILNLGILSAEAILIIRTYAIWNENRSVLILLIGWALANLAPSALFFGLFLKSLGWMRLPPGSFGCLVTSGNGLLAEVWVNLMIYESVFIALLAIRGFQLYKEQGKTPIILALFRDGAIFYLYIYALSVANVVVILTLNRDKTKLGMLASMERILHSVLTGRLILTLHKAHAGPSHTYTSTNLQSIRFECNPAVRGTVGSESGIGIGNNTVMSSFVTGQLEGRESQDLTSLDVSDQGFQSQSGGVEKGVC